MAKQRTLQPLRPNNGTYIKLKRQLKSQIKDMYDSLLYWLGAEYKKQLPRMAHDAAPLQGYSATERTSSNPPASVYAAMQQRFNAQQRRWNKSNAAKAGQLADRFTDRFSKETARSLNQNLKQLGLQSAVKNTRAAQTMIKLQRTKNTAALTELLDKHLKKVMALVLTDLINQEPPEVMIKHIRQNAKKAEREAGNVSSNIANQTVQYVSAQYMQDLNLNRAVWIHVPGFWYSRRTHERMNGKEFDLQEGLYDPDLGRKVRPGELNWCFTGLNKITFSPPIFKIFRRFYSGKLAQVVADDGTVFCCTPNHQILTSTGFRRAESLKVGDYLIEIRPQRLNAVAGDKKKAAPVFSEFFKTCELMCHSTKVLFGTDGKLNHEISNGKVDIIDVYGFLSDHFDVERAQCLIKQILTGPGMRDPVLVSKSFLLALCNGAASPVDFFMGGGRDLLTFLGGLFGKSQIISLTAIAGLDAVMFKECCNAGAGTSIFAGQSQNRHATQKIRDYFFRQWPAPESGIRNPVPPAPTTQAGAGQSIFSTSSLNGGVQFGNFFKRVQSIDFGYCSSHVYNLETLNAWYNCNYTTVHNCRCTCRVKIPDWLK